VKGFNQNLEKTLDAKLRFPLKAKQAIGEQRIAEQTAISL
jgi:hypothetical protein